MKAKDLIKILEQNPEWDVTTSVDISTSEDENDRRAFGDKIIDVIVENSIERFTICFDGYDNYNPHRSRTAQIVTPEPKERLHELKYLYNSIRFNKNNIVTKYRISAIKEEIEHILKLQPELANGFDLDANTEIKLEDLEIGHKVWHGGSSGFTHNDISPVTDVIFKFDEDSGVKYKIVQVSGQRFDTRTGYPLDPPRRYFIKPCPQLP